MKELTIGELKQILNKYPDNYKVVIPIHENAGISSPISEIKNVDYTPTGNGFGEYCSCWNEEQEFRPYTIEESNAVYLVTEKEIDFEVFSSDILHG
jgi:heme/copper-type cytochrome/quinol oxidase subunit 2